MGTSKCDAFGPADVKSVPKRYQQLFMLGSLAIARQPMCGIDAEGIFRFLKMSNSCGSNRSKDRPISGMTLYQLRQRYSVRKLRSLGCLSSELKKIRADNQDQIFLPSRIEDAL